MINSAVQRLAHKAVAILLALHAGAAVGHHIITFGIGVVTGDRGNRAVAQLLLSRRVIGLVTVRPHTGGKRSAVLFAGGNNVNHAADGIGAINRRTWATNIFNFLHQRNRDLAEIGRAADTGLIKTDTVDQHQHMAGIGATNEQRAFLPQATVLPHVYTRQAAHHIGQAFCLPAVDFITGDDGSGCQHGRNRLWEAVGGNHQIFAVIRCGVVLRPARKSRDGGNHRQQRIFCNCHEKASKLNWRMPQDHGRYFATATDIAT